MENQPRPKRARTERCETCGELFSSHGIHLHRERCAAKAHEPEPGEQRSEPAGGAAPAKRKRAGFMFQEGE